DFLLYILNKPTSFHLVEVGRDSHYYCPWAELESRMQRHLARLVCFSVLILIFRIAAGDQASLEPGDAVTLADGAEGLVVSAERETTQATVGQELLSPPDAPAVVTADSAADGHEGRSCDSNGLLVEVQGSTAAVSNSSGSIAPEVPAPSYMSPPLTEGDPADGSSRPSAGLPHISRLQKQESVGSVEIIPLGQYELEATAQEPQLQLPQPQPLELLEVDRRNGAGQVAEAGGPDHGVALVEEVGRDTAGSGLHPGTVATPGAEANGEQQNTSSPASSAGQLLPPAQSPQELSNVTASTAGHVTDAKLSTQQEPTQPAAQPTATPSSTPPTLLPQPTQPPSQPPSQPPPQPPPQPSPQPSQPPPQPSHPTPPLQPLQPQLQSPQLPPQSQPPQPQVALAQPTTQPMQPEQQRKRSAHTAIPKPDEFVMSMPATDLSVSVLAAEASGSAMGHAGAQQGMAGEEVILDGLATVLPGGDIDGRLVSGEIGPVILEAGLFNGGAGPTGAAPNGGAAAAAGSQISGSHLEDDEDDGRKINLAAASDGASIVAANKEAKRPDRLIDGDDDSYMKNTCSASKWAIVELSQLGRVDEIKLTMKEMYSSRVREFVVKGRQSHPKKDGLADYARGLDLDSWQLLGVFLAENRKGSQVFRLPRKARVRYLLLQVLSHYGTEEMCALNSLEVLGVTAAQELELALSRPLNARPQPTAAAAPGHRAGAQARIATGTAPQAGQDAAPVWTAQGTGTQFAASSTPVPQEAGQQRPAATQQLPPQTQPHQQQQPPQQHQPNQQRQEQRDVPIGATNFTAGLAGAAGAEPTASRGEALQPDGASAFGAAAGVSGGPVTQEASSDSVPGSSNSTINGSSSVMGSNPSSSAAGSTSNGSSSINTGGNSSLGDMTSLTEEGSIAVSGSVGPQLASSGSVPDGGELNPNISNTLFAPVDNRPQCEGSGSEASVNTSHPPGFLLGKTDVTADQDMGGPAGPPGEASCMPGAAGPDTIAITAAAGVPPGALPIVPLSPAGQSGMGLACDAAMQGLSDGTRGADNAGIETEGSLQAAGDAGQSSSAEPITDETSADGSENGASGVLREVQTGSAAVLTPVSGNEGPQCSESCTSAPSGAGPAVTASLGAQPSAADGAGGVGDAGGEQAKAATTTAAVGQGVGVPAQAPNVTSPLPSSGAPPSSAGAAISQAAAPALSPSDAVDQQLQERAAPVASLGDPAIPPVAPMVTAASTAASAGSANGGALSPASTPTGSYPDTISSAANVASPPAPTAQTPVGQKATVSGTATVPQAAPSLDSILSMLDVGASSKPRVAGNLFDVIKQEMMMLKLNQTRLWAYIHALVDALNARHEELEADAQVVEDKLELLDASLATVVGQAVARASEASMAPLAAMSARLAELEARAARAEAQGAAVLMYSSAVLGAAVLAAIGGGRWRAVRWLIILLSLVNGAVALGLHAGLVRVTLDGYRQAAAGYVVGLLHQATRGAFGK
ncbi:hypothetical protein Vretimale_3628, partial [Volvox reticuliferus]